MAIKYGRHICWEIHKVRKDLWAFFSWLYFLGADWLGRQTPITWLAFHCSFIVFITYYNLLVGAEVVSVIWVYARKIRAEVQQVWMLWVECSDTGSGLLGVHSGAWDDIQNSTPENQNVCLPESTEPRWWKEGVTQIIFEPIYTGKTPANFVQWHH